MSFGYLSLQLCRLPGVRITAEPKGALHFKVDFSALSNPEAERADKDHKIEHHWVIRHLSETEDELVRYSPNHNAPSTVHESHILPWGQWRQALEHIRNPENVQTNDPPMQESKKKPSV